MTFVVTPVTLSALTSATVDGTGVFDVLMQATKAHLDEEFTKNRLRGPEYSTVYLGALQAVMAQSLQFLLQRDKATLEALLVQAQTTQAAQQTLLLMQKTANAVIEYDVLVATKCKLQAEYDLLVATKLKADQETSLLAWKVTTEKAQTTATGVDDNSVVGKQKLLYGAQTAGFGRDAEQKAADIMVKTWNTRRMTDDATIADGTNLLNDATIGRVVTKLLSGVGA